MRRFFRFSIRDLLLLTLVVAFGLACFRVGRSVRETQDDLQRRAIERLKQAKPNTDGP